MKQFIRVAAIIVRDATVLVHQALGRDGAYHALPGGKLEPGESTGECVVRELREEFGAEIRVGRLLYIAEGWWLGGKSGAKQRHEIVFYYLASLSDPAAEMRARESRISPAWLDLRGDVGRLFPAWLRTELVRSSGAGWGGPARHVSADERPAPTRPLTIIDLAN